MYISIRIPDSKSKSTQLTSLEQQPYYYRFKYSL